MKNTRIRFVVFGMTLCLVASGSPVHAAKGVKKNTTTGKTHTMTGIVQHIAPDKSGYGTFRLRTAYHHKKTGANNATAGNGSNGQHQLTVGSSTKFEYYNGTIAPLTALKNGQHVRVRTTGQQAEIVQIMNHQRSTGNFSRYRSMSYRPHLYHHSGYHHRR